MILSLIKGIRAWIQSHRWLKTLWGPLTWGMVAVRFLLRVGRHPLSRLALEVLVACVLVAGAILAPPMPGLPEPRAVGMVLGTLLTAQGAIAALTLAVTLFMMQGIRSRSEVDDRVYREYVRRTCMLELFGSSLLAVGVTGALVLLEGFIAEDGVLFRIRPELLYIVLAAGLAFFFNLLFAGILFWRAISYSRPTQWMALRRHVNESDVREAVQAFLGRVRRALGAREASESDLSTLFPDQDEGSADEAMRALLDDARRAMLERRHGEFTQSLDSVMELIRYAMGEIRAADIGWRAPGSQIQWPPLRELSQNLYSFREDVIRQGDRDYMLALLGFDYRLTAAGVRERSGELFTVGLDGYRRNYQIAIGIGSGEFRGLLRDRFSLNAAGFIFGVEPAEAFLYAKEMVRNHEKLLSDAMQDDLRTDFELLHRGFQAFLNSVRLHWVPNRWPPSEASELYDQLEREYRLALMGLGGRSLLLARSGRVTDVSPYLSVARQLYSQLEVMADDVAQALVRDDSQRSSLWQEWEWEKAVPLEPINVSTERYPLLFFMLRLIELSSDTIPTLNFQGRAQHVLDWFTNNVELVLPYVLEEPERPLERRRELALEALRIAVRRDEVQEDYEIIGRDLSEARLLALKSEIHATALSENSVQRLFERAGLILTVSGDAADAPEERGFAQLVPKGFLTDTPEGASAHYATLEGSQWGRSISSDILTRFCDALEGTPEMSFPLQTPSEFLGAFGRASDELNRPEHVVIVLAGNWFDLQVGLSTENPEGYEVASKLPESERVGEIGRYQGHPILSIPEYEGRCLYVVDIAGWGQLLRVQFEDDQDLRIDINSLSSDRARELLAHNPNYFADEATEESKLRKLQTNVELTVGARMGFRVVDPSRARRIVPINQEDGD